MKGTDFNTLIFIELTLSNFQVCIHCIFDTSQTRIEFLQSIETTMGKWDKNLAY